MAKRLVGTCLTAVLVVAIQATTAVAQSSQVSQYVQPEPTQAGFEPGQAGELAFTGLMVLPLLIVGILVALGGLALRRRLG